MLPPCPWSLECGNTAEVADERNSVSVPWKILWAAHFPSEKLMIPSESCVAPRPFWPGFALISNPHSFPVRSSSFFPFGPKHTWCVGPLCKLCCQVSHASLSCNTKIPSYPTCEVLWVRKMRGATNGVVLICACLKRERGGHASVAPTHIVWGFVEKT